VPFVLEVPAEIWRTWGRGINLGPQAPLELACTTCARDGSFVKLQGFLLLLELDHFNLREIITAGKKEEV
jgi:hypothetical protein